MSINTNHQSDNPYLTHWDSPEMISSQNDSSNIQTNKPLGFKVVFKTLCKFLFNIIIEVI